MKAFDTVEKVASYALLALMTVIVFAAILELAYTLVVNFLEPPGYFIGVEDLFDIFGLFLMVLIGLELMTSIRMYLENHTIHAELMILVALTAVTRKVVILDAKAIDPMIMFGVGFVILSLAVGYYLMRRSPSLKD